MQLIKIDLNNATWWKNRRDIYFRLPVTACISNEAKSVSTIVLVAVAVIVSLLEYLRLSFNHRIRGILFLFHESVTLLPITHKLSSSKSFGMFLLQLLASSSCVLV